MKNVIAKSYVKNLSNAFSKKNHEGHKWVNWYSVMTAGKVAVILEFRDAFMIFDKQIVVKIIIIIKSTMTKYSYPTWIATGNYIHYGRYMQFLSINNVIYNMENEWTFCVYFRILDIELS